jgi:DNA-directed RNA polymerase III subunit RPC2
MVLKKFVCALKKFSNGSSERTRPPPPPQGTPEGAASRGAKASAQRFRVLEDDGICKVGERLAHGDVLVNKFTPANTQDDLLGRDPDTLPDSDFRPAPLSYKGPQHADTYVDRVMLSGNKNDTHLIKLRVRSTRRPELGDKFSSRHGQKGVVGRIVPQEGLPE